ncbi:MAG TPA: Arm DNA-binding domain-containing protein [Burkholderiales bacterium]|nr:Arm DNA-binding domain-containing protein [Burkholderiales bacterium]
MARQVHRLSVKQVENVAEPGYHSDGGGLYLQVGRALTKSWIFRYTRADQRSANSVTTGAGPTWPYPHSYPSAIPRKTAAVVPPIDTYSNVAICL